MNQNFIREICNSDYIPISGNIIIPVSSGKDIQCYWDGAALSDDGSIILIEEEKGKPNSLHIQGHVTRAALLDAFEECEVRLIWVVERMYFEKIWDIVESLREAYIEYSNLSVPPCEYRTFDGTLIAVSHRNK